MADNRGKSFPLGRIVGTPGALRAFEASGEHPLHFLAQHAGGEWGQLCEEDRQANDDAILSGDRILSSYQLKDGTTLWIITEADRSSTCLLLPSEY